MVKVSEIKDTQSTGNNQAWRCVYGGIGKQFIYIYIYIYGVNKSVSKFHQSVCEKENHIYIERERGSGKLIRKTVLYARDVQFELYE
jgi:hypothetical protein